jgi:hypothetical protein
MTSSISILPKWRPTGNFILTKLLSQTIVEILELGKSMLTKKCKVSHRHFVLSLKMKLMIFHAQWTTLLQTLLAILDHKLWKERVSMLAQR